jgi:PAS domain S-box-containing protein
MDYVHSFANESVLIVDNTLVNYRLLAASLSQRGYRVCFAPNAHLVLKAAQHYLPNLILIDQQVTEDGWEICQTLKADQQTCQIPIVVVGVADGCLAQARSVGAVDYIAQPFEIEEAVVRIENQLAIQRLQNQVIAQNFQLQQAMHQQQQIEVVLDRQFQKMQLLQHITEAIRLQSGSDQTFETVVTRIGEILQVDRCSIHMYVPPPIPEIPLVAEYVRPEVDSTPKLDFVPEDHPFIAAVLSHDRAFASTDVYADARLQSMASLCWVAGVQSLLAVRTSHKHRANGMILLQQCNHQRAWTPDEMTLIEAVAAQVGIAIAQAKSIEQEQKQLEALEYQNLVLRQEIQERKQIETALQASETELRDLFAAMMDVVIVLDRQGKYLRIAPTSQENLYRPAEDLLGKTLHEVFPAAQADQFLHYIQTSLDTAKPLDFEYYLPIQGKQIWFSARTSPFGKDSVLWVARDITARKQAESELLRKSSALSEFSNHLKQLHRLALTDFATLEELCADYLRTGCEILGFSNGIVGQIDGQTYRVVSVHSNLDFLVPDLELELCQTYCQEVFDQQQTICRERGNQDDKSQRGLPNLRVESYIGTPIWVDGVFYGTVCFFSTQPRVQGYKRHEPEVIELMAQSIGKFFSVHRVNAKQQQTEEEVQLLLNITQAITAAPDFNQALGAALQALCQATGWVYGEAWLPSADGSVLECSPVWYCNQKNQSSAAIIGVKQLRQSIVGATFKPGEGIAGRVWSQQQPEWTLDVDNPTESAVVFGSEHSHYRFQLVNHYGIKARLGVPITVAGDRSFDSVSGYPTGHSPEQNGLLQLTANASQVGQVGRSRVLAVLVFFTIEARQQDQRLIQLVSAVAAQLGTVLAQKQAEAELQALFTAMNDVVLVRDATGRCLKVASTNPGLHRPTASVVGKTLHETLPLSIANQILRSIRASLRLQTTVNLEYSVPAFDREICLSANISPLSDETVLIVTRDISDRKQVEEALARRERYLAAIVEVQRELLMFCDQQTQYSKVLRLLGQVSAASRVYLCEYQTVEGEPIFVSKSEWCVADFRLGSNSPLLSCFPKDSCQRWLQTLAKGESISGSLAEFPSSEQAQLKARQISSILVLPLLVNGSLWGFVEFNNCIEARSWDALESSLLSAAATAIALHHERKLAENALRQSAEREQATLRVIERMRQTLDIRQIFRTTAEELRQLLKCDRVLIYRFNSDWSGEFVAESVLAGWTSVFQTPQSPDLTETATAHEGCVLQTWNSEGRMLDIYLQDTYLQETQGGPYSHGAKYLCVQDVDKANFDPCYLQLLNKLQTKAYLTVPIFQGNRLWGLLASYQNSCPRDWQPSEIYLVIHISTQLAVALQQADLLAQTQRQSADLAKARDAAEAANRAKTQFLANMSHELRTPLNSILGFTQLIGQEATLKTIHQEYLQIVNRSGQHLLELINEVLEVAKLEAGRASLQETPFDLYRLLENIEEMLRLAATEKHLQFSVLAAAEVPQQVIADRSKLRQVLLNLLDNAIKFTQVGSVALRVRCVFLDDIPHLHFEVEDTGFGIAAEEMDSLFEAFVQTEAGRQSNQGTGLGLAISYRFVHLMGGQLQVRSVPGVGSVFEFTIPVQLASDLEQAGATERDSQAELLLSKHLGVHCIYTPTPASLDPRVQDLVLAEMTAMPKEWVAKLYQVAIGCSDRQVLQLIEQIPATSSNLSRYLKELVYNFQFDEIVELTQL